MVQAADDTSRFYGVWETPYLYNGAPAVLVSVHDASGFRNYVLTGDGKVQPYGSGTFSAADGTWTASADAPFDTGTYSFVDDDDAFCTNKIGQCCIWRRDKDPLPSQIAPPAQDGGVKTVDPSQALKAGGK